MFTSYVAGSFGSRYRYSQESLDCVFLRYIYLSAITFSLVILRTTIECNWFLFSLCSNSSMHKIIPLDTEVISNTRNYVCLQDIFTINWVFRYNFSNIQIYLEPPHQGPRSWSTRLSEKQYDEMESFEDLSTIKK